MRVDASHSVSGMTFPNPGLEWMQIGSGMGTLKLRLKAVTSRASFSASAFQQYSVVCFSASCTLFCIDTCRIVLELRLEHLPFLDTASVEISEHAEKARICWKAWFSGLKSHQHVVDFCWAAAEFVMHVQRTQFKTNLDLQCVNICQWFARCHYAL
jgi:hypothetical protein